MAADASSRYTTVPTSLEKLLNRIPSLGSPEKVNGAWLASIGMGGGNNQSMLRVLKALGAIGQDGAPTPVWAAIRGNDKPKVGAAVRAMYSDLFAIYPDANQKDSEALIAFFRANTTLGERAQKNSVATFQVLCKFGDFSAEAAAEHLEDEEAGQAEDEDEPPRAGGGSRGGSRSTGPGSPSVALTVNIQLQLPPNAEGDVYEKLFAAMAQHLKGLVGTE